MLLWGTKKGADAGNEVAKFDSAAAAKKFARENIEELQREYEELNVCADTGEIITWLIKDEKVFCHELAFANQAKGR